MRRIKLIVAYDGTNYCGWQVQPNGITVQEVLNQALSDLFAKKIACIGASRTDAGVHALGNVAVFDTDARMPADRIAFALNTRLPADIRIQGSSEVPPDFHPRFTATVKTYASDSVNGSLSGCGFPKLIVRLPCGSPSIRSTFFPACARPIPKFAQVVVLPTPPFWLAMAMICVFMTSPHF